MNYPKPLLPKCTFKKIENGLSDLYLIRYTPSKDVINLITNQLKDDAVCDSDQHLFDYSTSLLGHFTIDDNLIEIMGVNKEKFIADWDYVSEVDCPQHLTDFRTNNEKGHFFIQIDTIIDLKVPYDKNEGNKTKKETAGLRLIHLPTNSNYWHFVLKWYNGDDEIKYSDKKWKNILSASIKAKLKELSNTAIPTPIKIIKETHYSKE